MKQQFSEKHHEKFRTYFWIKDKPWKWDKAYIKKAKKYSGYISWLPWMKMVWVWNSISMNCSSKDSDIDLFIVTSTNTLWLNRLLITVIFQLLWVRKTSKKHAWRLCLSFFATNKWLNFSDFALKNDIYLYFRIVYFKPIINNDSTYEYFLNENWKWADIKSYRKILKNNSKHITQIWNSWWENKKYIKKIKLKIKNILIKKTFDSYNELWKPYWIIINDNMLKFHDKDIRKKIKKELA